MPVDRADISVVTTDARRLVRGLHNASGDGDNGAARIPSKGRHVDDAEPPSVMTFG